MTGLSKGHLWTVLVALLAVAGLPARAQTLDVVTEDSSYSYLQDGKVSGSATDVVERVLQRAGLTDYRIGLYPWARAYDMARLQPNVLIYPMMRLPERETGFHWIGELARVTPIFYRLRSRPEVQVASLDDARRYAIGVVRGDSRALFLEGKGFMRLVVSANDNDNFRKLLNGQIALLPMPEREARQRCHDLHVSCDEIEPAYTLHELSGGLYLAFSLDTPDDTVRRVREAFEQLKAEGTVERLVGEVSTATDR